MRALWPVDTVILRVRGAVVPLGGTTRGSSWLIVLPSCHLHGTHAPQIQRQAHELELGLHTVQSS
jgi:hypothetical protein